jgi:CubicO group peptidase (beta-lactamase class C family)
MLSQISRVESRWRNAVKPVHRCTRLWLAVLSVAAVAAHAQTPAARTAARRSAAPSAAADAAWPRAAVADPSALGFTKAGLEALDARMKQSVADGDTAGMTYILLRHGQVADFKTVGKQTPDKPMALDSLFRIYSMSKPITGVAMMQLYEQGKWQLDDPITKYAPELAGLKILTWDKDGKAIVGADGAPALVAPKKPATMRQLMSHTAGFAYGLSGDDPANKAFRDQRVLGSPNLDEMMKKITAIPLLYEPGTKWSYSVAVDIQGYLVQKLSGQKFGDYLKEHVTGPIGMGDTAFYVSPDRKARFTEVYHWDRQQNALVMNATRTDRGGFEDPARLESGGGGLVGSTHDYARFCQMMLNKGEIAGTRILKPETVKLMAQNHIGPLHVGVDGTSPQPGAETVRFGLDFAVYVDPKTANLPFGNGTYYWGGAAGTWFWIDPVNDLAFVGMIQNQGGNRPGGMNFRADSAKLVYAALANPGTKTSDR